MRRRRHDNFIRLRYFEVLHSEVLPSCLSCRLSELRATVVFKKTKIHRPEIDRIGEHPSPIPILLDLLLGYI